LEVFPRLTGYAAIESLWKITQPLVSGIGYDGEVAIETSGDLRLVVTQAYRRRTENPEESCAN
jgi:hypothetical protein